MVFIQRKRCVCKLCTQTTAGWDFLLPVSTLEYDWYEKQHHVSLALNVISFLNVTVDG